LTLSLYSIKATESFFLKRIYQGFGRFAGGGNVFCLAVLAARIQNDQNIGGKMADAARLMQTVIFGDDNIVFCQVRNKFPGGIDSRKIDLNFFGKYRDRSVFRRRRRHGLSWNGRCRNK